MPPKTIAIAPAGTTQHYPIFMIVIDREVGRGIQRHLAELVIGARHGHFTVQVDARTFRWEVATVETVIGPAVVKGEVIRREAVVMTIFAG